MKKIYNRLKTPLLAAALLMLSLSVSAQCTGGINYGSATLSNTNTAYSLITSCAFAGERSTLNVTNLAPVYSFSVTGPGQYVTIYNTSNQVVAFGNSPIVFVTFTATGTYYFQVNTSGPPGCGTQSACHSLYWRGQTPCSGSPASANVIATNTAVCIGATTPLNLSSVSNAPGLVYQWQASPTGGSGTYTNIGGSSSSITSPTLSGNTFFRTVVTCTFSNGSTTMTPVQVNAASPAVSNAVAASPSICPGRTSGLTLSAPYNGVTYQWYSSSSSTGPWTAINNATTSAYTATVPTTTYYTAVLSCSASPSSSTQMNPVQVTTVSPVATSAISNKSYVCPNDNAALSLANAYTIGVTYQWQASPTGASGSFTNIPGANLSTYNAVVSNTTHYQAVVACINAATYSIVSGSAMIVTEPTTTNTVPYFEGFEGITANNTKPNCSWLVTNLGTDSRTYISATTDNRIPRTGSKFASFYYWPGGSNYFYTNGIWMEAGVTYSANVWYTTDVYGYDNWEDLSIMIGQSQTPGALSTIVSTNGPAISPIHKSLGDTFSVAVSGLYYVAIRATSNTNSWTQYLSWDDLSITIPCDYNTPALALNSSTTTICKGQSVNLIATGADSYMWSNGSQTSSITVTPNTSWNYGVTGTNSLTGCSAQASQYVTVLDVPQLAVFATKYIICPGEQVNLTAIGADTYTWSTTQGVPFISVSPMVTTTYVVSGSMNNGCSAMYSQVITVRPTPTVTAVSSASATGTICKGEPVTLTASGAGNIIWNASNATVYQGPSIVVSPQSSTQYTAVGTDQYGCKDSDMLGVIVSECVGVNEHTALSGLVVYPNPASTSLVIELNNGAEKIISLSDISGRVIYAGTSSADQNTVDVSALTAGVYFVTVKSGESVKSIKIIKQ